MGDRFAGKIHIGGTLSLKTADKDQVERLINAINDESPDFGQARTHNVNVEKPFSLRKAVNPANGFIVCENPEISGGQFDEIEEACRELGLSYDRWSDPYGEYDGEYVRWRPDMKEPFWTESNSTYTDLVDRNPVLEAYNLMRGGESLAKVELLLRDVLFVNPEQQSYGEPGILPPFKVEA